jgi:hypothetical protein
MYNDGFVCYILITNAQMLMGEWITLSKEFDVSTNDVTTIFNVILTIANAKSKYLPSSGTKWLPIMTYIHPPRYTL